MQNPPDALSQLLTAAIDKNEEIRTKAQQEINNLTTNNLAQFLIELSKKQASDSEPNEIRQLSATLIKNIISSQDQNWLNLSQDIRNDIKNNILSTLICKDINIKKAAGLCIAGICKVELPKGLWNDIFDILINASQNNDIEIKITSLITLEFIYEDISFNIIDKQTIVKLLNNYYTLLSEKNNEDNNNLPLLKTCLKSIIKFVPFIEIIISDENSKLIFFNMIRNYMMNNDEEIRYISINIFTGLITSYYKYFESYMDTLMNTLLQLIDKDSDNIKKQCFDFILSIGEIEVYLINNPYNTSKNFFFLNKYKNQITPFLLKYIKSNNFDSDEDELTLQKYCSNIINQMCQCCNDQFEEDMLSYYKSNISSDDAIIKLSALYVFIGLLDTKEKHKIFHVVKLALPMLSSFLLEKQTLFTVRKLIAQIMKSISHNFGNLIVKDYELFQKFMQLFLNLLNDNSKVIITIILGALIELIRYIKTNQYMTSNELSQYSENYYQTLLSLAQNIELYDNNNNVPMNALFALGNFGKHVANDSRILTCNVFKLLVEMFSKTLEKNAFNNDVIRLNYQGFLCSSLSDFLLNKKCMERDVRKLFKYIIKSFEQRQEIYEEGIEIVGSIANYLQRGFINEMIEFNKYLLHGLSLTNSLGLCRASLITLSFVIISSENDFSTYVGEYLKLILNILSDNSIVKELKPLCLHIISDLFVYCRQESFKYFDQIMKMVGGAIQVCQMNNNTEMDTIDFINTMIRLKESILETLSCIFNAVQEEGKIVEFIPYAKNIIEFINLILREESQLNLDIIQNCIAIIADYCKVYGKDIKPILNINLIKESIEKFKSNEENMADPEMKDFISWAQQCITDALFK